MHVSEVSGLDASILDTIKSAAGDAANQFLKQGRAAVEQGIEQGRALVQQGKALVDDPLGQGIRSVTLLSAYTAPLTYTGTELKALLNAPADPKALHKWVGGIVKPTLVVDSPLTVRRCRPSGSATRSRSASSASHRSRCSGPSATRWGTRPGRAGRSA